MEEALLHEQEKNGKILMQLVVMTNELNERDSQIALLKKKEEHFEQMLQERENLYKQVRRGLCYAVVGCGCCGVQCVLYECWEFVWEVRTTSSLYAVYYRIRSFLCRQGWTAIVTGCMCGSANCCINPMLSAPFIVVIGRDGAHAAGQAPGTGVDGQGGGVGPAGGAPGKLRVYW
jgi:hypothetical protein